MTLLPRLLATGGLVLLLGGAPSGSAAWADAPTADPGETTVEVVPEDDADDSCVVEEDEDAPAAARAAAPAPSTTDEDDEANDPDDADDSDDPSADAADASDDPEAGQVLVDEDGDGICDDADDDGATAGDVAAAPRTSLATVRRTGRIPLGAVRLRRAGTVTQVLSMRVGGRTAVVGKAHKRMSHPGMVRLTVKLNPFGRAAIQRATGTVRLTLTTTVAPRGGSKRIVVHAMSLQGGA